MIHKSVCHDHARFFFDAGDYMRAFMRGGVAALLGPATRTAVALLAYADESGYAKARDKDLARGSGLSPATVRTHLITLIESGLIDPIDQPDVYVFNPLAAVRIEGCAAWWHADDELMLGTPDAALLPSERPPAWPPR